MKANMTITVILLLVVDISAPELEPSIRLDNVKNDTSPHYFNFN